MRGGNGKGRGGGEGGIIRSGEVTASGNPWGNLVCRNSWRGRFWENEGMRRTWDGDGEIGRKRVARENCGNRGWTKGGRDLAWTACTMR